MGIIAKYKFNNTLEANLLPEFNSEFTSDLYTVTDEVNGNVTTRTIESESLPTLMRFGRVWVEGETDTDNRASSLLEVLNMNARPTDCSSTFRHCNNVSSINLSNFDTSNVFQMDSMFNRCSNLTSLDLSNFDTSKVNNMNNMFRDCTSLTSLDLSAFNISNVTLMHQMFCGCSSLTSLDLSDFNTSHLPVMHSIFDSCNILKYLKCNNINTLNRLNTLLPTKTSNNQGTIICKSDITNLDIATLSSKYWNIDTSDGTMIAKYKFDKSIYNSLIPEFNSGFGGYFCNDVIEGNIITREIVGYGGLPTLMRFGSNLDTYVEGSELALLEILDMNTSGLTNCYRMFRCCNNLTSITCEWDTSKVTDMQSMFYNCTKLTTLDLSNWDTSNVTTMYTMFYYCTKLTTLDLSNWDTSNVTTMRSTFYSCNKLTSLDLSNFNTSKVTSMYQMFRGCNKLTSLDVSNFNTSKVTDMEYMFYNCNNLTSLDLSNWDTSNETNMAGMFNNTPLLADIGVLYMDKSSLQKLVNVMPTDSNKTLWYKDVNINGITHGNNITLKKYIEENVEIVLNSPLLMGDTIEVVDGKLCHYHKMGMVVLDGSENWTTWINSTNPDGFSSYYIYYDTTSSSTYVLDIPNGKSKVPLCDKLIGDDRCGYGSRHVGIRSINGYLTITLPHIELGVDNNTTIDNRLSSFKQWLQANPTTVVYELASPYYEDITPLQSSLALRTFNECNIQIITVLPIKTKITYRTNITSAIVMEQELDTLDSGVSLSNLIEEEVNE